MKSKWKKIWSKRYSIRLGENWIYSISHFNKFYGFNFPDQVIVIKDGFGYGFVNKNQLQIVLKKALKKIYTISFKKFYEDKANKLIKDFYIYCEKLSKIKYEKVNNQDILKNYEEYIKKEDEWMNVIWMAFILDEILSQNMKIELSKHIHNQKDLDNLLLAIFTPVDKTAAYYMHKDLISTAYKVRKNHTLLNIHAKKLTGKYSYFSILNMDETPYSAKHFASQLKKVAKSNEFSKESSIKKEAYEEIKRQFSKNKKMTRLIEACNKIAFYREYRNDMRQKSYFFSRHLFLAIAKKLHLSIKDLIYLTRNEIISCLNNQQCEVKNKTIQDRKKYAMMKSTNKKVEYTFDKKEITKFLNDNNNVTRLKILKGICAYPGKVIGRVRIIKNIQKDANKLRQGEILVTTTTNLAFTTLISKALGVITDEGGALCHAAIISREMEKPCVVGVHSATTFLKDKDLVELNADKGTIKKLKC